MKAVVFVAVVFVVLMSIPFGSAVAGLPTVQESDIVERNGRYYLADTDKPFTGVAVVKFANGRLRSETHYRSGRKHGEAMTWYRSGEVRRKSAYKDGERHGEWVTWSRDRRVLFHQQYKGGRRIF